MGEQATVGHAPQGGERVDGAVDGELPPNDPVDLSFDGGREAGSGEERTQALETGARRWLRAEDDVAGNDPHVSGTEQGRAEGHDADGHAVCSGRCCEDVAVAEAVLKRDGQSVRSQGRRGVARDSSGPRALHEDKDDVGGTEGVVSMGGGEGDRPGASVLLHEEAPGGDGGEGLAPRARGGAVALAHAGATCGGT